MNLMNNELQCKRCGKLIKGGCYNAPDGPFCVECIRVDFEGMLESGAYSCTCFVI